MHATSTSVQAPEMQSAAAGTPERPLRTASPEHMLSLLRAVLKKASRLYQLYRSGRLPMKKCWDGVLTTLDIASAKGTRRDV